MFKLQSLLFLATGNGRGLFSVTEQTKLNLPKRHKEHLLTIVQATLLSKEIGVCQSS